MKKQLTDATGQVYLTIMYDPGLGLTRAQWTGEQTNETVLLGAMASLEMVRKHRSTKFLNDSSLVTGTWHEANAFIADQITPEALKAGLRYFAYVVPPSLEGKLSIVDLHQRVGDLIHIKVFYSAGEAEEWLKSVD